MSSPIRASDALTGPAFQGHRPTGAGDLSIETHGIAPIPLDARYGTPRRLFTVWFAPQVTMTGVFTGTLAISLGLGFWLGLLAMVIGTTLGSVIVGYLSTWGPRTGAGQLPIARMAFGGAVMLPAGLQWVSSIAWDALVGLFGGEALSVLLGVPFWAGVLIVLGVQGAVGIFGYELIHRLQAVLTVVLFLTFLVFAGKLIAGAPAATLVTPATVSGADLVGAFVLEVTLAFSLAVSWATYAADFSRYLPARVSRTAVAGFTTGGLLLSYVFVQAIGIAAAGVIGEQTAEGVRTVMGGGVLGAVALLVIAVASVGSGVMNDYSGSLALQTVGVRVRRPVSAVIVTASAFAIILWLHAADTAQRFTDVLLLVSYWIPAFVAIVVIDWRVRARGRDTVDPSHEPTSPRDAAAAVVVFVVAYLAALPFMNTTLIQGPVAAAWHGADIAYFVNLAVAALLYGGYRAVRARGQGSGSRTR